STLSSPDAIEKDAGDRLSFRLHLLARAQLPGRETVRKESVRRQHERLGRPVDLGACEVAAADSLLQNLRQKARLPREVVITSHHVRRPNGGKETVEALEVRMDTIKAVQDPGDEHLAQLLILRCFGARDLRQSCFEARDDAVD